MGCRVLKGPGVFKGRGCSWGTLRIVRKDWGSLGKIFQISTPPKTNMTIKKSAMNEEVFPIENGDFPMSFVSFQGCSFSNLGCFWVFLRGGQGVQVR